MLDYLTFSFLLSMVLSELCYNFTMKCLPQMKLIINVMDMVMNTVMNMAMNMEMDMEMDMLMTKQTDRQMHRPVHRHTHTQIWVVQIQNI